MDFLVDIHKTGKEFEKSDENEVLAKTWNKMKSNIGESAFREGAFTGKDSAFQNGFDSGYSLGYQYGYSFGYVKGLKSILEEKFGLCPNSHPILDSSSKGACCICLKENTDANSYSEVEKLQKETSSLALSDVKNKYSALIREYGFE